MRVIRLKYLACCVRRTILSKGLADAVIQTKLTVKAGLYVVWNLRDQNIIIIANEVDFRLTI